MSRQELLIKSCFYQVVDDAVAQGANAILSVRYDTNEIMEGIQEVFCYGTACRVVPKQAGAHAPLLA
ncbi:hypothetical protein HDU93_004179 [Gonapodya sp. JEL0774]|nr:hypothetical protein HDU93_004179 [Gonapodya sp. JEL0774]